MSSVGFYLERNLPKYDKSLETECQDEIIKNNLRLVRHIMKKRFFDIQEFCNNYRVTEDEIFSAGTFGLIKAVKTFDASKGYQFTTYASRCIYNELGMFIRKHKRSLISLEQTINEDSNGNELTLADLIEDYEDKINDVIEAEYSIKLMDKLFTSLKPKDKEIFKLYVENKMTQREIGEYLGLSQSYISRILKRVLLNAQKIRSKMEVV